LNRLSAWTLNDESARLQHHQVDHDENERKDCREDHHLSDASISSPDVPYAIRQLRPCEARMRQTRVYKSPLEIVLQRGVVQQFLVSHVVSV